MSTGGLVQRHQAAAADAAPAQQTATAPAVPKPEGPHRGPGGTWIGYQLRRMFDTLTPQELGCKSAALPPPAHPPADGPASSSAAAGGEMPLFAAVGPELLAPQAAPPLEADKNANWLRMLYVLHTASTVSLYFWLFIAWHWSRSLNAWLDDRWLDYVQHRQVVEGRTFIVHFGEILLQLVLLQLHCCIDYVYVEACQEAARSPSGSSSVAPPANKKAD